MEPKTIVGDINLSIPGGGQYEFAIVSSTMHKAWVRTVCGRIKSDFRYSNTIVYNNFPWRADPSDKHRAAMESATQAVLDARAAYRKARED